MTDTVDKIIIQSETRGVQQTTSEVQGLSKAMDGVTVASEKTERSSVSIENKFAALERRLGTTAAQARQFEKDQKTINDAVAQNPGFAARAADAQAALAARYINSAKAADVAAKSTGLARHELANLGRQAQDVLVSLQGGQGFGTVLLQQGTQIADVFANSQGSVRGFFSQLVSGASAALTPMRILAGGVLGLGSAAIYISNNWTDAQRQIDQALIGIGRRSGETRQSINRFASENASATGLSVAEARNVAIEFAKTGNLAASGLKGVTDAVRGYSLLTGKDASEATKELAGALSGDLVAAALKVDSVYGVMNAATLENIRALEAQGERAAAVQIILDRMAPANQKAAESVGVLSKAWTGLTNVLSNVAGGGSLTADRSPQENVDDLVRRRDEFPGTNIGRNERGELQQFKDAADKAEYFRQKLQEAQAALDAFNTEKASAQLQKLSGDAFSIGNAILPQIDAISKLDGAIRKMQEAQSKGVGPANSAGMIAVLQRQKDIQEEALNATIRQAQYVQQLQAAWGGVSSQTAVALASLRDQLNVAQQVTGAGQIRAQQEATINSLLREGKDIEEASAIAREQRAVAEAAATANVERQTQALRDQNDMIRARQNGTEATTAAAIAYRSAIDSGADSTAAAALKAETLKNHLLQAAGAADNISVELNNLDWSEFDAANSRALSEQANWRPGGSFLGTPSRMGAGGSSRSDFEINPDPFQSWSGSWTSPELLPVGAATRAVYAQSREFQDRIVAEHERFWEDLDRSITRQTEATKDNTDALKSVTLNPLYTEGRSALRVGYMHAAKGLDVIAQGPTTGDQVPFHAMVNGGERITITPAGQTSASNDNSKTTIVNNNFVFNGSSGGSRRSKRQVAQGYGQVMASLS